MKPPILIGTRGWDDPDWRGSFYPEELPPDWRFCFYSNKIRSVLVPAEQWEQAGPPELAQWAADSDPGFTFTLELPAAHLLIDKPTQALARLAITLGPVSAQVNGILVKAESPQEIEILCPELQRMDLPFPLCVDVPGTALSPTASAALAAANITTCWRPADAAAPPPSGSLLVCLTDAHEPRQQRGILEALAQWQGARGSRAALYFHGAKAPASAEQARIIAELLMV